MLIDKLTHKKFDLGKYKDTFVEKFKKALKTKKKSVVKMRKTAVKKSKGKKSTLATSLKESLREHARR